MNKTNQINLDEILRQYGHLSFKSAIQRIADEGSEEITMAVHPAFDLGYSQLSVEAKNSYLKNTRDYFQFCKEKGIKILHFRDMLPIFGSVNEPALSDKFGINADYEVPTFPNMGVPLDLTIQYFEQKSIYGIFVPSYHLKNNSIKFINAVGGFIESDACFPDGLSVMEATALDEVRVIRECIIQKKPGLFDINAYGHPIGRVVLYSFKGGKIEKINKSN
ncbi:hypothetical protein HYW20_00525 [Candidatus Woesearchaeota archaeon]|nr:hypothetical protein [Candidatus Woesearchaeota archaeon]